ncbi:cupredoxin domain-containing protein [Candidatus Woesearchaeota archaeon]|nr:cupredoxin domain-containing protein [Candidatus Woesearchaeota archaeon]
MRLKLLIGIALLVLILGCSSKTLTSSTPEPASAPLQNVQNEAAAAVPEPKEEITAAVSAPSGTELEMEAAQNSFDPNRITVRKGDKVVLRIRSKDVDDTFNIAEYKIHEQLTSGKTTDIEFVADKRGTFLYYCSSCGDYFHTRGKLIVQ